MNKALGIDISTYQRGIDLSAAKEEGINFVIIRGGFTGYGTGKNKKVDDTFLLHYENAKSNNLNVGVYYFSRAISFEEGESEAQFLYENCLKGKTFEYPIFIDVEDTYYQQKAGKDNVSNAIRGFCEYLENKGFYVGVYCNLNWANNYMNYNELSKDYDFWLAYWGSSMPDRNKYGNYGMWQYGGETNLLRSNNIAGKVCDQNYSYKDYPSIMKNVGLNNYKKEEDVNSKPIIDNEVPNIKNNTSTDEDTSSVIEPNPIEDNSNNDNTTDENNNDSNNDNSKPINTEKHSWIKLFFTKLLDLIISIFKK